MLTREQLTSPSFAVKRLKPGNNVEKAFRRELATLKRLSGQNHAHLIKLELTYFYRNHYHLLFRWADGNLQEYWKRHPEPSGLLRTHEYAAWMVGQWLGLARGLLAIHRCPADEESEQTMSYRQADDKLGPQHRHGRHGNIKPENILWFSSQDAEDEPLPANGKFVLSDFALTEFHQNESEVVDSREIAVSLTYRAPEYDVSPGVAQSYDIWSLGCVLLEFIVWYLQGYEGFDQFSLDRCNEDTGLIREDKYFKIARKMQSNSDDTLVVAALKDSVNLVS